MFVYSVKTSKGKMLLGLGIAAAVIILLIVLFSGGNEEAETVSAKSGISYSASTSDQRISFLEQFGWEVKSEPVSVTEELIPEEFDKTYEEYNIMQKLQSLDLSKYKGKRVKKWTYEITNYPDAKSKVYANMLVLNGKVVGGDVSSAEKDGFMHGFSGDTQTGAGVDVIYELTDNGTLAVQGGAANEARSLTGGASSAAAASDDITPGAAAANESGSNENNNSDGVSRSEVSNPQTGDSWVW